MEIVLAPQIPFPKPMVLETVVPKLRELISQDPLPSKLTIRNIVLDSREDWFTPSSEEFSSSTMFLFRQTYEMVQVKYESGNMQVTENAIWLETKTLITQLTAHDRQDMVEVWGTSTVFIEAETPPKKTESIRVNVPIFLGFALKKTS